MKRLLALLFVLLLVSCGSGGNSPTSPTPAPTVSATRVIALDGSLAFGDVIIGQTKDLTVTIRNTGTGVMTMTGITGSGGVTTQTAASPTTGSVSAGGSLNVVFRFTPSSAGAISGTITFTTDHTSGTNTIALSGNGVGPPVTITGIVSDSSTRRALSGVRVSALGSNGASVASSTTDGNGFYSFVVPSATALSMTYTLAGYDFQSATVTFTSDTRRDINLSPAAVSLEYRVSGTGAAISAGLTYANCTNGTSQQGDAQLPWSFTCGSIPTGQFLYISAQNNRNSGCVKTQIFKRGALYRESESCGAFVIATSSGSY